MPTYANLDGSRVTTSVGDFLKWQAERIRRIGAREAPFAAPRRKNDGAALRDASAHLTWIGHSTFVQRLGGKLVATDPIWSERIGGAVRRLTPAGVALDDVPPVDVVTVSHSHYDHLDLPTLERLRVRSPGALFVVPKDNGGILRRAGIERVVELDWWESHVEGDVRITIVPAQHWSFRYPWDRNQRLWGGFVIEGPEGVAYHAGDTAFSELVFREIAKRFPRIDWAMIPIGAYAPAWFMSPQHIGPEDAGRAWEILGARHLVAMHWGTFKLTDEPLAEPPERMRAWWRSRAHEEERLWIFDIGETRALASR